MTSDYSDSDGDRHRSRHKSKRYSRSRSASRDRNRSRKSKKSRHRHRTKSRSRSPEKRSRRRSRSHSSEHSARRRAHRKSKSRSHSRSDHDSRRSSRSRDSQKVHSSKVSDHGKETTNNAQIAEQKLQKALKAAITADDILRAQGIEDSGIKTKKSTQLSLEEQQKRASAINDIESGDFVQETFKSSRSEIPMPSGSAVDASHAGAMFSSGATILPSTSSSVAPNMFPSNSNSIMHPNLYVGVDEKMERWKQKVLQLRKQTLAANITVS